MLFFFVFFLADLEVSLSVLDWFSSFPKAKNESYLVTYRNALFQSKDYGKALSNE